MTAISDPLESKAMPSKRDIMSDGILPNLIVPRRQAIALGLTKYFTGRACPQGHIAERWTSSCCCVPCIQETSDSWREKNREKVRSQAVSRYAANPAPHRARRIARYWVNPQKNRTESAAYRLANPEKAASSVRKYHSENPDKIRDIKSKWDAENKERSSRYNAEWRRLNPEKDRAKQSNRRARKLKAGGSYAAADIVWLLKKQRGRCALPWCRKRLLAYHCDHIMPLALGGTNYRRNLQLLCKKCNLSKGAKHPITFAQKHGVLL